MKQVAIIADSHFDEHSRFEECISLHEWIAEDLRKRKVDLVIHTGDVFERKSTPTERLAVATWLKAVSSVAPVIIVRGNHDALGDLALFRSLRSQHPILVEEAAGVHVVAGIAVAAVAWPRKAHLLAGLTDAGHEESEQAAATAMRNLLKGLGDRLTEHNGPRILAMHAMVRGSVTSVGQPLVGCDLELGLEDLAGTNAQFVALGHIHKGQDWMFGDLPIVYPGSPRRTAFGEVEEKAYVLVDVDDAGAALWEPIAIPATPMFLVEDEWGPEGWLVGWHGMPPDERVAGAELRCRYTVAIDQRDAARRGAQELRERLLALGAAHVKVEEVVTATVRARAPEIAAAKTLDEKLAALWRARKLDLEQPRVERLLTKTHQLEGEDAA